MSGIFEGQQYTQLTRLNVKEQLRVNGEPVAPPFHLAVASVDTIPIVGSLAAPTYFTGFFTTGENSGGFTPVLTGPGQDEDTGAIRNDTGKTLTMSGSIAYLTIYTGFLGLINVWSERSTDGINWTPNENSYRNWDVSFASGGSVTQKSAVLEWKDGEILRFAMANTAGGTLSLESISETVNGDQDVSSFSVFWTLTAR